MQFAGYKPSGGMTILVTPIPYSELLSWVSDMRALVVADELAKDVAGAEAIIQCHKERKEEIDAQDDSFKASSQFGQSLISSGHYESEQVKEIVSEDETSLLKYGSLVETQCPHDISGEKKAIQNPTGFRVPLKCYCVSKLLSLLDAVLAEGKGVSAGVVGGKERAV